MTNNDNVKQDPGIEEYGNFVKAEDFKGRLAGRFASLDMALFTPRYISMGPHAKLLYSVIMHHAAMSAANGWTDNGAVYVKLSQKDLAYTLGAGRDGEFRPADTKTVRRHLDTLRAYGLIVVVKSAPVKKGAAGYQGQTSKIFPLWPVVTDEDRPAHWSINMMVPEDGKSIGYEVPDMEKHQEKKKAIETLKRAMKLEAGRLAIGRAEEKLDADLDLDAAVIRIAKDLGLEGELESITEADLRELRHDAEYRQAKETIKNIRNSSAASYREYNRAKLDEIIAALSAKRDELDRVIMEEEMAAEAAREEQEAAEAAYYGEVSENV